MDSFKKALKIAISKQAAGIRHRSNSRPELILSVGEFKAISSLDIANDSDIQNAIDQFLGSASEDAMGICEGELNIVSFGEIKLLAQTRLSPVIYAIFPGDFQDQLISHFKYAITVQDDHSSPEENEISDPSPYDKAGKFSFKGGIDLPDFGGLEKKDNDLETQQESDAIDFERIKGLSMPAIDSPVFEQNLSENSYEAEGIENESDLDYDSTPSDFDSNLDNTTAIIPGAKSIDFIISEQIADKSSETDDTNEDGVDTDQIDPMPANFSILSQPVNNDAADLSSASPSSEQDEPNIGVASHSSFLREIDEDTKITDVENDISVLAIAGNQQIIKKSNLPEESTSDFLSSSPNIIVDEATAITSIVRSLIEYKASDLYLTTGRKIFFRIDSSLHELETDVITQDHIDNLFSAILTPDLEQEFKQKKSIRFTFEIKSFGRFRVSMFKDINGTNIVLRHIPLIIPTIKDIRAPDILGSLAKTANGLFLVTGPFSSGKSTTIAAMIDHVNKLYMKHIITLEDPIELRIPGKRSIIHQKQISCDVNSLAEGISSSLEQNPDIIVISDLNNKEATELAIEAAITGHLVIAVVRAKSITAAFDRILGFFDQSRLGMIHEQLGSNLCAVVHQNLLKKKEGGSIAVFESLNIDQSVRRLIAEGNHHLIESHIKAQKEPGQKPFKETIIELIQNNVISPSEALRHVTDKANFIRELQKSGYHYDFEDVS